MAQRESHTFVCWIQSITRHCLGALWTLPATSLHVEANEMPNCPWNWEEDVLHHNIRSRSAQIWITQLATVLSINGSRNPLTNAWTKSALVVFMLKHIYLQLVLNRKTFSSHLLLLFHHGCILDHLSIYLYATLLNLKQILTFLNANFWKSVMT